MSGSTCEAGIAIRMRDAVRIPSIEEGEEYRERKRVDI
jgi:hypothetical protein